MNLWESFQVALEGLAANKMRSALTMLGVIIGVAAVIAMLALAGGAKKQMMGNIQSMGTNLIFVFPGESRRGPVMGGMGSVESLTLDDADAIREKCESVKNVAPEVQGAAQVKYQNKNTNCAIVGTTPDFQSVRNYAVKDGRFFTDREVKYALKVAIIGPTTATTLFGEVTPLGKDIRIKGIRFRIIGLMATKGTQGGFGDPDDQITIPISTAMRRVFGVDHIRNISVEASSQQSVTQASDEITKLLRKRHRLQTGEEDDFNLRTQSEVMAMANTMATTLSLLLGGVAGVSLLVGGIGIMNIMLVSVTERTREIGIRMALGARRHDILMQFLVESLVLSLVGGILGICFGELLSVAVTKALFKIAPDVSLMAILLSFGFSASIGIIFGIFPAQKASRLDPIDALRYE
jgi:ABC-type antimicrobial peptide transport system permease subunit